MRKLATALAVSIALSSGNAHALSLGEIEMRSALNQPMSAEIQLSSVRPGELENMIVKLASPEAFARAGIDRTDVLSDLRFSVNQINQSIVITSRRPVVEPFLNFLLEIDWPSGRMVREYTVLLDPPVFLSPNSSARTDTAADTPAIVQRDDTSLVTPTPIQRESVQIADGQVVELEVFDGQAAADVVTPENVATAQVASAEETAAQRSAREAGAAARAAVDSGAQIPQSELITLDTIESDGVVIPEGGEVVSLTDLGAPNVEARAQNGITPLPEVELIGGGAEAGAVVTTPSNTVSLEGIDSTPGATGSVVVERGDTLGVIADRLAGNGVSSQQMMMALLAANESAFINNNINLVKAGATLRIPTAAEASGISQAQAIASVSEQSRLWQEYRDTVRANQRGTEVARAPQPTETSTDQTTDNQSTDDQASGTSAASILESARDEVLSRDELQIVADSESASTAANATSDESTDSDEGRLGEINRKLQLAREELASSLRESGDLSEQSDTLQNTGENLDTLVTLQQNDIAKLEAQLEAARNEASAAEAADSAANAADSAADAVADATDSATNAAADLADSAGDAVSGAADAVANAGEQAADSANAAAAAAAAAASNAGSAATEAAAESKGWLEGVMSSNLKWIPIGLGAIFGLGLLGTLFLGRRKKKNIDAGDLDEVEFLDDSMDAGGATASGVSAAVADQVDSVTDAASSGISSATAAGGAGVAAAAAAAGFGGNDSVDDAASKDTMMSEDSFAESAALTEADIADLDHDDTISEVDVYLAYGLHGQAEELLTKAIDRDDDNAEYQVKLLETYAAQGNTEGYSEVATQFQQKFGASHASWAGISARGAELDPGNALFSGSADAVASVGVGRYDEAPSMGSEDFLASSGSEEVASTNRGFGGASDGAESGDESHLMDQSIDPAFAFDEADLEATGDFSQIADEIAAEGGDDTGSLDFPSFDSAADSITDTTSGIAGAIGDKASDAMNDINLGDSDLDATSLDMDEAKSGAAEDLTLDLNQLSGDIELDSTELLDDSLSSAEGLDFNVSNDSDDNLLAGTESLESVDEMDTMMDLAKAYIDMGDNDSASSALDEIVKSGNPQQVSEAETLKQKIS